MGQSKTQPASGAFVRRQYQALNEVSNENKEIQLSYYEMPKYALKAKSSLVRYCLFLFPFIKRYVFSRSKKDVLHVHFFFPTIILAIVYKLFRNYRVKIIVTFHGNDIYYYKNFSWWYRWCFSFVDHSIFVSERLKKQFFKQNIKHDILCAGILPIFKEDVVAKKYDVMFVGTLDKNKGIERLIELIKLMPKHFNFVVVGSGEYQPQILALSSANTSISYFSFCEAEQLVTLYQQSEWLVNLSYQESFGLVISEAMACGVPVIASETDGALSQIKQGKNGYIFKQNSELLNNVSNILNNTALNNTTNAEYKDLVVNALTSSSTAKLTYVTETIMKIYLQVTKSE
jgi:L-malate glycosyltransferase